MTLGDKEERKTLGKENCSIVVGLWQLSKWGQVELA
jgi:hypothetical protein